MASPTLFRSARFLVRQSMLPRIRHTQRRVVSMTREWGVVILRRQIRQPHRGQKLASHGAPINITVNISSLWTEHNTSSTHQFRVVHLLLGRQAQQLCIESSLAWCGRSCIMQGRVAGRKNEGILVCCKRSHRGGCLGFPISIPK